MRKITFVGITLVLLTQLALSQLNTGSASPPIAMKVAKIDTAHGDIKVDNYYWLRQKTDPRVITYLEAENKYMEEVMKPTEGFQETIYKEILSRTKQTDLSVPYKLGNYWYYTRTEEGKQYSIYCRKLGSMDAPEQITLDLNELAKGHKFMGLGLYQITDDGNLLAYSLDTTGFRQYQLYFKDLRTGAILPDSIGQVNSAVWAADNKAFFYVKEDHAKRPYWFYRHVLGGKNDDLLYEEKDELYRIGTYRSSDKKFIFLGSASSITTEARYLPSNRPSESFKVLLPREVNHEYYVDHREGLFYIRTNKDAKNYRLVTAPVEDPQPNNWKEVLPHRPSVKLEGLNLFKNYAVFNERKNGLTKLRVHDFRTDKTQDIEFPEPVYSAFPSNNPEFNTSMFRFSYQSFITPSSMFDYNMDTGKRTLLKQTEVLGGYDPTLYYSERLSAKASDGTVVPISLVYKKGIKHDGFSPMLLSGYGSYGASSAVTFSIPRLSLLDRGVIYALAHIRGGGEMGEVWHDEGKMMKKKNTFSDFIACAEHLIKEGYTSKERLAIQGGSAGGLLIGAV
ncbi:MAG TPA: S9 family peptidase, partial [Bacteroidota bacterium]|nr:S9 family peptidase [Bacteroidota bacterium]